MRPLILHASALNDDEYALYTSSITDLALCDHTLHGDRFYEEITISVREARAWLKGRYPDIPVVTIDIILKFFSPTLGPGDMLSGGQFFAVLRLVVHVQNGREVDRSLAFVQARPSNPSVNAVAGPPQLPRRSVDSANNPFSYDSGHHPPVPPVHPFQRSGSGVIGDRPNNPFVTRSKSLSSRSGEGSSKLPPLPPRKPSTSVSSLHVPPPQGHASTLPPPIPPPLKPKPVVSPLIQQSLMASKTAKTMKKAEEQLEKERVLQVLRSSAVSSPFMNGSREASPSKRVLAAKSDSSTSSWSGNEDRDKPPALPRRRPRRSPTVSTSSLEQVALATPPRSIPHTASPFDSPVKPSVDLPPPTHPDRKPPSLPSTSTNIDSARSFEAVYHTSRCSSPTPSPLSPSSSATSKPPYSFSVDSATATMPPQQQQSRMFRSRSLHYHPTTIITTLPSNVVTGKGPPPVPPPKPPVHSRRKRPESLQVVSPSSSNGGESFSILNGGGPTTAPVSSFVEAKNSIFAPSPTSSGHRRSSYSSPFSGNYSSTAGVSGDTTTGTIQRKLQELQLSAIPVLEKARYKAEAGLSPRRGFIPSVSSSSSSAVVNGLGGPGGVTVGGKRSSSIGRSRGEEREGLLSRDDDEVGQDSGDDDNDNLSGTLRGKEWRVERPVAVLRDEMKWPPGEGWNRL